MAGWEDRAPRIWCRSFAVLLAVLMLSCGGWLWHHRISIARFGLIGAVPSRLLLRYDSSWIAGRAARGVLFTRAEHGMLDTHCRMWYCRKYTSDEDILRYFLFVPRKDGSLRVEFVANYSTFVVAHRLSLRDCRDNLIAVLDGSDASERSQEIGPPSRATGDLDHSSFPLKLEIVSLRSDAARLQPCIMFVSIEWSDAQSRLANPAEFGSSDALQER